MTIRNSAPYWVTALGLLLGCAAYGSETSYKLILTSEAGDHDSPLGHAMRLWEDLIEEKSNGRMQVEVFYQGELGGQQELFDQLIRGNVDMMITWPQTSYDERIGVNYIPYLVLDWEDAIAAFSPDGWVQELMAPIYEDIGLKYIGPFPEGFGGIATQNRYATSFEDAQGIKVRSQPVFPLPQTVNAMGFQAVPIDWAEVYTSLQTGVVDGDSSNVIYWDYEYFGDVLDYFVQSSHNFSSYSLLMSDRVWDEMDATDREIVTTAAREVIEKQFAEARAEDEHWIATAQEGGMEYIVPTTEEKAAWVERVRSEVWPLIEESLGTEIMDVVRENASVPGAKTSGASD
ncbi:TRAP transporter substrate-binding protein DctP [Paracoccus saliphilus]|uniref:TRAP transporter substrate-binding protein DctP n=1 Tax=Paracoccus saliphilus TaxID=405559 RepID=A0AA45W556_9RHOB|nr:TRAP transporter substrate-binding protein DctP [Paracoccus saliphilus]WCR02113.1 TRAP transporter substrate-binding protein DctP [Paracoccus saliphilus]SIS90152.1 TRAP-type C4-dicarboxylate transport system, substrate-binding protein [Paracoccus saliphilus]